ncbi:MAG: hypothetical protein WAT09_07235 [Paracoccaceae bacterium]
MSQRFTAVLLLTTFIAGCGGNPFAPDREPGTGTNEDDTGLPTQLPGTTTPTASKAITRYEDRNDANGNGYAENITLNTDGSFSVDNLGFDGANAFTTSAAKPTLGPFGVYEAAPVVTDPKTGNPIQQFEHRLIAGKSNSGRTGFTIVRTGAYESYGFGGFLMSRDATGVTLPDGTDGSGQATYSGKYGGVRDFDGAPGLQLTDGDMTVDIDFKDFNRGDAVKGVVRNRHIYDLAGNDITGNVLAAMDAKYDPDDVAAASVALPVLTFDVGPGAIDANGEIRGVLGSRITDYRGTDPQRIIFEAGNYYAIVSGPDAAGQEIVGIIVVESENPYLGNVTARETGGFILYR